MFSIQFYIETLILYALTSFIFLKSQVDMTRNYMLFYFNNCLIGIELLLLTIINYLNLLFIYCLNVTYHLLISVLWYNILLIFNTCVIIAHTFIHFLFSTFISPCYRQAKLLSEHVCLEHNLWTWDRECTLAQYSWYDRRFYVQPKCIVWRMMTLIQGCRALG